jgi:hypothetical protein
MGPVLMRAILVVSLGKSLPLTNQPLPACPLINL